MIKNIFLLIILLSLSGCGCNYHLKKVQSKCGFTQTIDTVIFKDTIITERVTRDTLFKRSIDTVILKKDNLIVKYFYNTKDSTIYLQGKCDTIIKVITKKKYLCQQRIIILIFGIEIILYLFL